MEKRKDDKMEKDINKHKVLIINGISDKEGIVDGNADFLGYLEACENHVDDLIAYGRQKYPDIEIFKKMNDRCFLYVPICFLTALNNVVYLNVFDKKWGKRGLLFLPDVISDNQRKVLFDLAKDLAKTNVDIIYDLKFDEDGFVSSQELDVTRGNELEKNLEDYFILYDRKMSDNKKPKS